MAEVETTRTRSISGVIMTMAAVVTALTGLLVALHQLGVFGETMPAAEKTSQITVLPFQGTFMGQFTSADDPTGIPVETVLEREGESVTGIYRYGGGEEGVLEGTIRSGNLHFEWRDTGSFGSGVFYPSEDGREFSGTWRFDYSRGDEGRWNGQRQ